MSFNFIADIEHYAIFKMDPDGCVSTWNTGAERMKGYSEDEILGTHYRTFFVDEAANQGTPEQLLARAEAEGSIKGRGWRVRKDGTRFWADFSLTALFNESGDLRGFAKVAQDATTQRQYEQTLEQQTEQLGDFAEKVSHDLTSPLNVALGNLELAQEEYDEDYHLDTAIDAIERSLTTIDDLLALARDEDHASSVEGIDLAEIAKWCWQTIETTNETLVIDTNQRITAVPTRLKQILENLLGNAIEHGGEGVTVTIGDLENGFYVADSGVGIPENEREEVFKRGYSRSNGTGLGLHFVQENVDSQRWNIGITESETGGARFEITGVETVE